MVKLPGPRCFPIIGTSWTFWPIIGTDKVSRMHEGYLEKYKAYGKIVKESAFRKNIISVFDPKDIETVFHSEQNTNPQRTSHEILLAYRRSRPDLYSTGGLVPTNGVEWKGLRTGYQKEVLSIDYMNHYLPYLCEVADDFVNSDAMNYDFVFAPKRCDVSLVERLQEWALESICIVTFGAKLNKHSTYEYRKSLIDGANAALDALAHAEYSPWWRIIPRSDTWKTVADVDAMFYSFVKEKVNLKTMTKVMGPTVGKYECILTTHLLNQANDVKDVVTVASDLIFTGILTTPMSMAFMIYNLSLNPTKQALLYEEITRIYPTKDEPLTMDTLNQMTYLHACMMENFRTFPITLGTSRVLQKDLKLAGHVIPAGSYVLAQNQVAGKLPDYVMRPDDFIPERWLRGDAKPPGFEEFGRPHPFLVLPFGSGPRSCLGRRLAEIELKVLTISLLKRFRILEYSGPAVGIETKMISLPDKWIEVAFLPRGKRNPPNPSYQNFQKEFAKARAKSSKSS